VRAGRIFRLFSRQRFYAEDKADRFLRKTFFRGQARGVMVEVGAAGPTYLSMSRHFRESGWRVIAIEPNPHFVAQHRAAGFDVVQVACGDHDEDGVDFEIVNQPAAYAGGKISYESFSSLRVKDSYRAHKPVIRSESIKVNLRRLDTVLEQQKVSTLDLLSIDVEGWELEVLAGFSLERYRPRVVIMENFNRDPGYVSYMLGRGYRLHSEAFPNQVFVPS
jgi:FkbM family methyltransferase